MHKLTERKISEILFIKASLPTVVLLGALVLTPFSAWAAEDSDNPHQFGELSDETGVVQEENVQGRTITGPTEGQIANTIFGTDDADTILGSPTDDRIEAKD